MALSRAIRPHRERRRDPHRGAARRARSNHTARLGLSAAPRRHGRRGRIRRATAAAAALPPRPRLHPCVALWTRDARRAHRLARGAPGRGARPRGAGGGRHPRWRPHHGGDPRPAARARRGELPLRRAGREAPWAREADPRRFRRPRDRRSLRLRLRHGREGLLAQPSRDPRHARVLMLAIIGGSGLNQLANLAVTQRKALRTPYGEPADALTFGRIGCRDVVFLARHGQGHRFAPHEVNYRANLWALKDAGALEVVSVATVGGIHAALVPGALVLPDQLIDYTWGRHGTYHEGSGAVVNHIDFTEPYSHGLRNKIRGAARSHRHGARRGDGPRATNYREALHMIREVLRMGDPRLLQRSQELKEFGTPELFALLADMRDTMAHLNGAGLAAPQIGVGLRVVIFGVHANPRYPDVEEVPDTVLINPVLTPLGDEMEEGWEGCLSVPGMRGWVPRYRRLRYRGHDVLGTPFEREVSGFHARVVQHEVDHLDGILYPMRIRDFTKFGFIEELFPGSELPPEE